MTLWLLRHTRANVPEGICYGRSDIALPASFPADAQGLLEALDRDVAMYSSPLQRCALLAQRIAKNLGRSSSPVYDARLSEMNFGDWEGRAWSEVDRTALDAWAAAPMDWRIPGGETVRELATRATAFLDGLTALTPPNACVVTHGGVVRMLCAKLWQQPFEHALDLAIPYGSALKIKYSQSAGAARLVATHGWDETSLPEWMSA